MHEKIQNFMVPIPAVNGWHEEQVDELFASLLGRGFTISARDAVMDLDYHAGTNGEAEKLIERADEALQLGFRVFG